MSTNVKVTAKDGAVIMSSANPEFGAIRLESTVQIFNEAGFLQSKKVSALVKGKIADLEALGWTEGKELPGKLVIRESLEKPFDGAQPKRAGVDGNILTKGGQPIYRDCIYDPTGKKEDVLIQHDTVNATVSASNASM